MTAIVVTMGFDYADALGECLASIVAQDYPDIRCVVIDDASPDPRCQRIVTEWCDEHGHLPVLNPVNMGTVYNAWHGVAAANPARDDVIIFLDADDRFDGSGAVSRIVAEYDDPDCWLTYGSYRPDPPDRRCPTVERYPVDVIADRSFRGRPVLWNHPLSCRGFLWEQLDVADVTMPDGSWGRSIYDQWYMNALLELAGPCHRMIDDVVYVYNTTHPTPDNAAAQRCDDEYAAMVTKPKLPRMFLSDGGLCMDWRDRCAVIVDHMRRDDIRSVVETGTADGATALRVCSSTTVDTWWTVESDAERARIVADRFAHRHPNIVVLTGLSPDVPRALVASDSLPDRVLWWLDAHLPIEDAGGDVSRVTPIMDELAVVIGRGAGDVILVDDARLFGSYPGYPTLDEVEVAVGDLSAVWGVSYSMTVRHDIIRLVPT